METYHKINTVFKRNMDGDKKLIYGDWSMPEFEYLRHNEWEWTEKVDGTNIRIEFVLDNQGVTATFGGRTESASIPAHLMNYLVQTFGSGTDTIQAITKVMLDRNISTMTFYGEGYGPKIQGGGKYRDDVAFVLFDVRVGTFWLDRNAVDDLAAVAGVESVPIINAGSLLEAIFLVSKERLTSQWGMFEAEGLVVRPTVPMFNRKGERVIAKIKCIDF